MSKDLGSAKSVGNKYCCRKSGYINRQHDEADVDCKLLESSTIRNENLHSFCNEKHLYRLKNSKHNQTRKLIVSDSSPINKISFLIISTPNVQQHSFKLFNIVELQSFLYRSDP